jgi:hypothetical protein
MKKFVACVLAGITAVMMLCTTVSAEGGLNTYEEALINELSQSVVNADGVSVFIPTSYVNQAKNYFISSVDMTKEQYEEISAILKDGIAIVKAGSGLNIAKYSYSDKAALLKCGQEMVAVIGMTLTYDGSNVVIVDPNGKVAFSDSPVLKTTGNVVPSAVPAAAIGVALFALAAAGVVVTKKHAEAK